MKQFFGVFNTDQINRDGFQFTVSAMEDGMWQSGVYGMPMHLSHDIHRPVGWSIPFGMYFEPGITYTVGRTLLAENDSDTLEIANARENSLLNRMSEMIEPYKEDFLRLLNDHKSEDGKLFYASCVTYISDNILHKVFPDLEVLASNEKDNLVYLDDLLNDFEYLTQGVFKHKKSNYCIFAHPYFRKSLSRFNNFHYIFLDELVSQSSNNDVKVRILLDADMIGFAPSFLQAFEFEYWWGPEYNNDITKIPVGLTQYGSDDFEKLYYSIHRTEFFWKHDEANCEFELEEVRDEPAPTIDDFYGCRYVHSIYDTSNDTFFHFDGAIRAYSTEQMIERLDVKMSEFGRRSAYTKLFRIDGKLGLNKWKSLVTNYLQGNPQIYEYFGLDKPDVKQVVKDDAISSYKERIVPYSINQKDGIRLLVSYHQRNNDFSHPRYVSIFESLSFGDEVYDAIEFDVIEVKKALSRLGEDLFIPDNLLFLGVEDEYVNIPCIFHSDDNNQHLLNQTLIALKNIFGTLADQQSKKVFAFTLSWNYDDKEIRLSVLGHVHDLNIWLRTFNGIPIDRGGFKTWLEQQATYLSKYGVKGDFPELSEIIKYDGVLYIKRRSILPDIDIVTRKDGQNGLRLKNIPHKEAMITAIRSGLLSPINTFVINDIKCSVDNGDYKMCEHSVFTDENVSQILSDFNLIGSFWSDKPA